MKHSHFWTIFIICTLLFLGIAWFFFSHYRALAPVLLPPPRDITEDIPSVNDEPGNSINATDIPLTLPEGFTIEVLAKEVIGARVLALGPHGYIWVSQMQEGVISHVSPEGIVEEVFTGLNHPHGLAFEITNPSLYTLPKKHKFQK